MEERRQGKYLSNKEVERYHALANAVTIKEAALKLGISPQTLYNWMSYVKTRYKKHHGWCNATLAQMKRGGCLKNLLKERKQMIPPEVQDIEGEEE